MNEARSQHPKEPAEGDTQAPDADRPGQSGGALGNMTDDPAGLEHPAEPAEGREEAEEARGAERHGGDG
jgi:hypothetical protein